MRVEDWIHPNTVRAADAGRHWMRHRHGPFTIEELSEVMMASGLNGRPADVVLNTIGAVLEGEYMQKNIQRVAQGTFRCIAKNP